MSIDKNDNTFARLEMAAALFVGVLLIGTFGYMMLVPQMSWFNALYMTVITVSTIGYGEVFSLEGNMPARLFTIFIAFIGIGVLTYMVSNITAIIVEGDLRKTLIIKNMEKKIHKLRGHYIICGMGRVGRNIGKELQETGRSFVFADLDEAKIDNALTLFPGLFGLVGDGTEDEFLASLNIEHARGVFVSTDNDNTNLVITLTAKQLNPNVRVISMCKDPVHTKKMMAVGADRVISPNFIGGMRMASEMIRPAVTTFLDIMLRDKAENLRIEEVPLHEAREGATLSDLEVTKKLDKTLVLAIKQGAEWIYNPGPETILNQDSTLIVMTNPQQRQKLEKICGW